MKLDHYFQVPCDLYILKTDVVRMENGDSAIGHISVPKEDEYLYDLIDRQAFLPITKEYQLDSNSFDVVFICD